MATPIIDNAFDVEDTQGRPVPGGKVYTYEQGTTTPKETYSDEEGTTPNTNPVVLDSSGRAMIFGDGSYTIDVKDMFDAQVNGWPKDIDLFSLEKKLAGIEDDISKKVSSIDIVPDLRGYIGYVGESIRATGYYTPGDGGGGPLRIWVEGAAPGTYVDNGGSVIVPDGGDGSEAWVFYASEDIDISYYGATTSSSDSSDIFSTAYAIHDNIVVDKQYNVTDFVLSKPTRFTGDGKLIVTGSLTIDAPITSPNKQIIDTSGVTSYIIGNDALHEIKNLWFSDGYGTSQTVYGNRAGVSLFGKKISNGTDYNIFHGYRCGELTEDAIESAFFGTFAGASCSPADLSTGIGYGALRGKEDPPGSGSFNAITAVNTTAVGQGAFQDGTSHTASVAIGTGAGKETGTSQTVALVGANAARLSGPLDSVTIVGGASGYNLNNGGVAADSQYTTIVGANVGFDMSKAARSTIVGSRAGLYSDEADDNTWCGYLTGPDSIAYKDVQSAICLGKSARTRQDNTITIGNDITNLVADSIRIGGTQTDTRIIGIYVSTIASTANVYVDSDNRLYRSTSSLEYKDVLEPVSLEWAKKVLDFDPILYKPTENAENPEWSYYGYGAEQVAKVDPRYVQMAKKPIGRDEDTGETLLAKEATPNGVMYDRIVVAQGLIIKDLICRIEALEKIANQ